MLGAFNIENSMLHKFNDGIQWHLYCVYCCWSTMTFHHHPHHLLRTCHWIVFTTIFCFLFSVPSLNKLASRSADSDSSHTAQNTPQHTAPPNTPAQDAEKLLQEEQDRKEEVERIKLAAEWGKGMCCECFDVFGLCWLWCFVHSGTFGLNSTLCCSLRW